MSGALTGDAPGANAPMVNSPQDFGRGQQGVCARWFAEIEQARREFNNWYKECRSIERVYRGSRWVGDTQRQQFAILWSNIETLKPAIYARPPVPVVARQFSDADPVGRAASMILRRCIQIQIEDGKVHRKAKQVRDDYLLYGRGVMWASYRPRIGKIPQLTTEAEELGEDERLEGEEVVWDFVHRSDFLHQPARNWESVTWVARQVQMTRDDGIARFGEKFRNVPLNFKPERRDGYDDTQKSYEVFHRARVYEIWDIRERKVIWLADGYWDVLDSMDDPLHLHDFFPCPRPLYGTLTDTNLVPVPDYVEYEPQAQQLDKLTFRIRNLTEAIKATGVYNSAHHEISRMFNENAENELIPVRDWAAFADRAGFKGNFELLPVLEMAETLERLITARAQVKNDLYEITGISDVIRGAETTSGDKTATEIRTKGRYASLRLTDRQFAMAEYIRDVLRITGEIIAEHFSPETLFQACNWQQSEMARDADAQAQQQPMMMGMPPSIQLFQEAVGLLRDDRLRSFRIDVEDKSTIAADEEEQKAARVQFLESVAGFTAQMMALPPQLAPTLAPMIGKLFMFGVRGFPVGLEVETAIEDGIEAVTKQLQQQAANPQPSPEMMKAQADAQKAAAQAQAAQMQAQTQMQMAQMKMQESQAKAAADLEIARIQLQIEMIKAQAAGVSLQAQATQAQAQNAQDQTEHVLKAAANERDDQRLAMEAQDQAHRQELDWAKLGLEADRLDMEEDKAEAGASSDA